MRITVEVSTKDRYDSLAQALLSLALQSTKDFDLLIFDDADIPKDLRTIPVFQNIFQLLNDYKIGWQVIFGRKLGQHYNHQQAQEIAKTPWLFRFDDDEILEPDVLEKLLYWTKDDVGAVAGLVLPPAPLPVPGDAANVISDLNRPNIQWFKHPYVRTIEVDHLHSTFLYRRGLVDYELSLSPAAHREETLFTYEFKRKGYKLLVDTSAVTWHFREPHGGIRSHHNPQYWLNDEQIFNTRLKEWGINSPTTKMVVMDNGRGDHVILRKLIPDLKKKYEKVVVASCFPDVLADTGVEQISIAQAKQMMPIDHLNIYRNCIDWNWKDSLEGAFRKLYGV